MAEATLEERVATLEQLVAQFMSYSHALERSLGHCCVSASTEISC
jgi:hypothetical protein